MYGYIYKISNTQNNKIYVGQTTKNIDLRFRQHLAKADYYVNRYGNDSYKYVHLYLAMNKYGKDCFKIEQIDTAETQAELDQKEAYWIEFYDAINTGYNMMPGSTKENPMSSELVKSKHDNIMRSDAVRKKISDSLKRYRQENGVSEEHRKKLSEAQQNRKCFIKDGKITYTSLNNEQKVNELLADGWVFSTDYYAKDKLINEKSKTPRTKTVKKDTEHNPFATRSLPCYCILDTGERFDFESIIDAGKWWYDNYKPFGEVYSTATYQRKIEASIAGKEIVFGNKTHKKYKKITNIVWYNK